MTETVYLLGAGLNQNVVDWHGLKPPLANNLFQMALRHDRYAGEHYSNRIAPVYKYISRYWKKSKDDLRNEPFNLEECFTMLQLQQNEAERVEDYEKLGELARTEFHLIVLLAEFLSEFEDHVFRSEVMTEFGKVIYREHPTILTLNYELILERIIESASGVRTNVPKSFLGGKADERGEIADEELPYSHFNWNRLLGYGIKFDEVQLQRAGISTYVRGSRFYNHPENQLYTWNILKLHGSLNWFHYLPVPYPTLGSEDMELSEDKQKETILVDGRWRFNEPQDHSGWLINPLIITPVLHKEQFYQHTVFLDIWKHAHDELSKCKRLVVIGYSFAPTDFNIRKLLLEAFCENTLEELIVVNPDTSVVRTIKELSHFQKPVLVCQDLEEYLRLYSY